MTLNGWLQISSIRCACCSRREAARALPGARLRRLDGLARAPSSARSTASAASIRTRISTGRATPAGMLLFSLASMLLTYVVLRLQHLLPLNPQHLPAVPDRQAFETAASFTTNTNWQSYGGETTMSYFSQMTQLAFHNFMSAAVGMAVAVGARARHRAARRRSQGTHRQLLGRTSSAARCTCCCRCRSSLSLLFVQQGVIQNFKPYLDVTTLEGAKQTHRHGAGGEPGDRSSSSARTAAASSTRTPRIRSRTRRRGPTSGRCSRSS